jgi:hypothetical protein
VRAALVALLGLLVASCAHAPPPSPPPDVEHVAGPGYEGVIFSAEFARRYFVSGHPVWTVTRKMVDDFERKLASMLRERRVSLPTQFPIKRQYLGFYHYATHRPLLRGRLLCPSMYSEDQVELGDFLYYGPTECHCDGWYDPSTRKIVDFGCNVVPGLPRRIPELDRPPPGPPPPPPKVEPEPPTDPLPPNL